MATLHSHFLPQEVGEGLALGALEDYSRYLSLLVGEEEEADHLDESPARLRLLAVGLHGWLKAFLVLYLHLVAGLGPPP